MNPINDPQENLPSESAQTEQRYRLFRFLNLLDTKNALR
jgi:hypothetical protein